MKQLSLISTVVRILLLTVATLSTLSRAQVGSPKIVEVTTAADDTIVVVIEADSGEVIPSQAPASWRVNGIPPIGVGRWSYPWDEGAVAVVWPNFPITMRHHMYLQLSSPFVNKREYSISTPYGTKSFTFDDHVTRCEAIKVNQVGYYSKSNVRYANFGVYLGDLKSRKLASLPSYEVIAQDSGSVVYSGQASYFGDDTGTTLASGEHVYRLDLSAVSEGGPYYIAVSGLGRSHKFGIGRDYSRELAYVHTRGLYHQRCGIALEKPYTKFTHAACHTKVEVTDAEPPEFIKLRGTTREIKGGYHDAGDFDRRLAHTIIPAWMLSYYEAFPDRFYDSQFNIPESGNGIPDWLDEALWGVLLWENLQESDGGVRAGTETDRHPLYGEVDAETDSLIYRTFRRDGHTTAVAAGLFAHAARLLKPFDAPRADKLSTRALDAWNYVKKNNPITADDAQKLYAGLQLYLLTGDEAYHDAFKVNANYLKRSRWPEQYYPKFFNQDVMWRGMVFSPYFFSYTITEKAVDKSIRQWFVDQLSRNADEAINYLKTKPYPLGQAPTPGGYGTVTNQGRYADPLILMYRLDPNQKYVDAVSQLADYSMGLNPIGKSYATGLGANPPNNPLHLNSYFTNKAGLGNVPGIVVYGPITEPSAINFHQVVWSKVFPGWLSLPEQRRYTEGWSLVNVNEFTTWETSVLNACMYAFLNNNSSSSQNFAIRDRSGISLTTAGGSGASSTGYARIQPDSGNTTPAGMAIFGLRQNNILVSEAAVPASPLVKSARIYAEVNATVDTGVAIANPNNESADISFYFTDANGQDFAKGNTTIPANGQLAKFLDQPPFNSGNPVAGTFTFNASLPVSVVALRGFLNQRSEFLMTTLPVAELSVRTSESTVFPHFADGGGWMTQIVLVNPSNEIMDGTVQFFDKGSTGVAARPVEVTIDALTNSIFTYSIPARSSRRFQTSGSGLTTRAGSVRLVPSTTSKSPAGLGIFSFKKAGITVSEAGVPALTAAQQFRFYAEASGKRNGAETGIAIANPSATEAVVKFELTDLLGVSAGLTGSAVIPGNGQISTFLNQIEGFTSLKTPFQGIVRISTTASSGVSVIGLRTRSNERDDYLITTTSAVIENTEASTSETLFPHVVAAGGYTTQFILFSGSAGQSTSGVIRSYLQSGKPLYLTIQ